MRSPFELQILEHGLDCRTPFERQGHVAVRNISSSPGSILERGYLPTPLRPPRLVRWCTKGRALLMCESRERFSGRRFSSSFPPGYFLTASREAAKLFVDAARSTWF